MRSANTVDVEHVGVELLGAGADGEGVKLEFFQGGFEGGFDLAFFDGGVDVLDVFDGGEVVAPFAVLAGFEGFD
ncbi:MAG TPA: hypothetical protein VHI52_15870, partial [Verrucomicrobiae bacterium]|nr:hypothetical protein [Verrucomicrobiae bacterium]